MKPRIIIESLTTPTKNFFLYFLFGVFVFPIISGGLSNLFWDNFSRWLQNQLNLNINQTQLTLVIVTILITAVFTAIYLIYILRSLQSIQKQIWPAPSQIYIEELKDYFPGLIALMSPKRPHEESPAERVILHHLNGNPSPHLKHCWLICTSKSLQPTQELEKKLIDQGFSQIFELHYGDNYMIDNPENPKEKLSLLVPDESVDDPIYIQKLVNCIYADAQNRYGLDESEIIADFTGGTKPMTVGVVLAGITPSRRLQYISQLDDCPVMEIKLAHKLKLRNL
jgi:hypothetical protein